MEKKPAKLLKLQLNLKWKQNIKMQTNSKYEKKKYNYIIGDTKITVSNFLTKNQL